jgi:hypothetical protein
MKKMRAEDELGRNLFVKKKEENENHASLSQIPLGVCMLFTQYIIRSGVSAHRFTMLYKFP